MALPRLIGPIKGTRDSLGQWGAPLLILDARQRIATQDKAGSCNWAIRNLQGSSCHGRVTSAVKRFHSVRETGRRWVKRNGPVWMGLTARKTWLPGGESRPRRAPPGPAPGHPPRPEQGCRHHGPPSIRPPRPGPGEHRGGRRQRRWHPHLARDHGATALLFQSAHHGSLRVHSASAAARCRFDSARGHSYLRPLLTTPWFSEDHLGP